MNTDPRDRTLAELENEIEEPTKDSSTKVLMAAYVERMDELSGLAHDFITEALQNLTYERFDEITRESINSDEIPETERRLIHAMIQSATITVPERDHIEHLRDDLGGDK